LDAFEVLRRRDAALAADRDANRVSPTAKSDREPKKFSGNFGRLRLQAGVEIAASLWAPVCEQPDQPSAADNDSHDALKGVLAPPD
jgi:hypothetical protein